MFYLKKKFTFQASHQLDGHPSKCARLHGHTYTLEITLKADSLPDSGHNRWMLKEFSEIKTVVQSYIDAKLCHHHLNTSLGTNTPTVEFITKTVFDALKGKLPELYEVLVWEGNSNAVYYREE